MSRIVFHESYIVVIPTYRKTDSHKHPFMHLFGGRNGCNIIANKKEIQGNIILLKSNIEHAINEENNCDFFLLIEPTSTIAEQFLDKYMLDSYYHTITECVADFPKDLTSLSDKEIFHTVQNMFLKMGISIEGSGSKDERMEREYEPGIVYNRFDAGRILYQGFAGLFHRHYGGEFGGSL